MKKLFATVFMFTSLTMTGMAQAEFQGPVWACQLEGEMSGASVGIIIGIQSLRGEGVIHCQSPTGDIVQQPVKLKLAGIGIGLGLSKVNSIQIFTAGIGVMGGADALLGKYNVGVSAGTTLINRGVDADLALALTRNGMGFEVGVTGRDAQGLEAHVHATTFSIKPIN